MRMLPPLVVAVSIATATHADDALTLPSGRSVTFHDSIWGEPGPAGLTIRFRFIEPDLASVIDATPYEELESDMHYLCETYALDRIANTGPQPATVMISISDRTVAFGAPDPDAKQVFEAYTPEDGTCVWEGF